MNKNISYSIAVFFIAFIFRVYTIPHLHHVYYDEFLYLNTAENIVHFNVFAPTVIGDQDLLQLEGKAIRPNGYPLLLSFFIGLHSDPENAVFLLNILLGSLSVVLIFWIVYLTFGNNLNIAFWSAVVLNFLPAHLKYSGSGSADIASLFFVLLSCCVVVFYFKKRIISLLYISLFAAIYSVYVKPENIVFLLLFPVLFIFLYRNRYIKKSVLVSVICLTGLLIFPLLNGVPVILKQLEGNAHGSFLSFKHLLKNVLFNFQYLFDFRFHSLISTIFFISGGIVLSCKERKKGLFLLGWFILFYVISCSYFHGMFSLLHTSDGDRHFFPLAIPFVVLAGYGISIFLKKRSHRLFWAVFVLFALIVNSAFASRRIISYTAGRNVFAEYQYLKESSKNIPDDMFIVTYAPYAVNAVMGKKVVDAGVFVHLKKYPRQIVLFRGFFWSENKEESISFEKILADEYDFKTISERMIEDLPYGFYLLTFKSR